MPSAAGPSLTADLKSGFWSGGAPHPLRAAIRSVADHRDLDATLNAIFLDACAHGLPPQLSPGCVSM